MLVKPVEFLNQIPSCYRSHKYFFLNRWRSFEYGHLKVHLWLASTILATTAIFGSLILAERLIVSSVSDDFPAPGTGDSTTGIEFILENLHDQV